MNKSEPQPRHWTEKEEALMEKLRRQPQMREQVEAMLEEIEDEQDRLASADDAEEAMVRRVRELGRLGLERWAQNKAAEAERHAPQPGTRKGGKKNSAGRAVLEK